MKRNIKRLFTLLCFVVLILMVGYWFYKYLIEDKDVAVVDYLSLEEAKDVAFPVPTICFQNPFQVLKSMSPCYHQLLIWSTVFWDLFS